MSLVSSFFGTRCKLMMMTTTMVQASDLEFVVVRQPVHGHLVLHQTDATMPAILFNADDLAAGRVTYEHDHVSPDPGSATIDTFGIVARLSLRGKRSQPRTVHVAIAARNVEPPSLTNHRVLRVNIGTEQCF